MTKNHNYYLDLAYQLAEKNLGKTGLNIIEAIHLSAKNNKKQKISIKCEKPKPFSNKEINSIIK